MESQGHIWTEPIERALAAAKEKKMNLFAPKIGETAQLDSELHNPISLWWEF